MILKIHPNRHIYGKYFLATEAPGDEDTEVTEEQPKPRRNVKVVSVKPTNRSKDFTQVGVDPITPDTAEVEDNVDIDDTDYSAEPSQANVEQPTDSAGETTPDTQSSEQTEQQPAEQEAGDVNTETQDDAPDTGDVDNTDFSATDNAGETGADAPDTGGGEDFTGDASDTGTQDSNSAQPSSQPNSNQQLTAPGVELDSTRKYNLYKEYMSLYNACDNYISKLENILRNDSEENQIIRISVTNLRDIKDILFDYMTIRFQLNTYVQSLLFYQKMVVSVQLVFKLLKSIKPAGTKK